MEVNDNNDPNSIVQYGSKGSVSFEDSNTQIQSIPVEKVPQVEAPSSARNPTVDNTISESARSKKKFVYIPPNVELFDAWITLSLRCITWKYLNFELEVSVDTPIALIRLKITERHEGTVSNIVLYKDKVGKANAILVPSSDSKTSLLQCGFKGGKREDKVRGVIYYDFVPFQNGTMPLREIKFTFLLCR